jgi:hypothetical protein
MTGQQFEMFKIKSFVPEVIKRCTRDDLLFPLLDFLIGSVDSISSMEFKRYDSSSYQRARDNSRSNTRLACAHLSTPASSSTGCMSSITRLSSTSSH